MEIFCSIRWRQYQPKWPLWQTNKICGRHLIDRISDWPNPRGFTKGVHFVCLYRYVQVDRKPFGQSEIRSIRVLRNMQHILVHTCLTVKSIWLFILVKTSMERVSAKKLERDSDVPTKLGARVYQIGLWFVVKWSACSPSIPTILVRFPL